jgi:hypothetical protein
MCVCAAGVAEAATYPLDLTKTRYGTMYGQHLMCVCAGVVAEAATYPLDLTKTRYGTMCGRVT